MKIAIAKATPLQLNWLIAQAEGLEPFIDYRGPNRRDAKPVVRVHDGALVRDYAPTEDWAQAGAIIDRECISVIQAGDLGLDPQPWGAARSSCRAVRLQESRLYGYTPDDLLGFGKTPLLAAMRCHAVRRFGPVAKVPDELVEEVPAAAPARPKP